MNYCSSIYRLLLGLPQILPLWPPEPLGQAVGFMGNRQLQFTASQKHALKFLDQKSSFSASSRINNV